MRKYFIYQLDWVLVVAALFLLGLGLVVLHAITLKDPALAASFNPTYQIFYALAGVAVFAGMTAVDYRVWKRLAPWIYGLGVLSLGLVLLVGDEVYGATRWIDFGFIQFQPAELAKIGLVLILARLFSRWHSDLHRPLKLLASLAVVAVPAGLIALEPDLGTAVALGFIWLFMLFVANVNRKLIGGIILAGLLSIPLLYSQLAPYQQQRVDAYLNPFNDPQGSGYNVVQSTIAVGSGQLVGRGLSAGSQSQLNFLPSQHTDFVFAVTGEKLGFLGAGAVILLFGVVLARSLLIALRAEDNFGMLVAGGVVAYLLFHVVVNIGMNLGLLPVTGIPLPLVSYGGTNLIVTMAALGLLQSIHIHRQELEFKV